MPAPCSTGNICWYKRAKRTILCCSCSKAAQQYCAVIKGGCLERFLMRLRIAHSKVFALGLQQIERGWSRTLETPSFHFLVVFFSQLLDGEEFGIRLLVQFNLLDVHIDALGTHALVEAGGEEHPFDLGPLLIAGGRRTLG